MENGEIVGFGEKYSSQYDTEFYGEDDNSDQDDDDYMGL
jgi:hypothetical protein